MIVYALLYTSGHDDDDPFEPLCGIYSSVESAMLAENSPEQPLTWGEPVARGTRDGLRNWYAKTGEVSAYVIEERELK